MILPPTEKKKRLSIWALALGHQKSGKKLSEIEQDTTYQSEAEQIPYATNNDIPDIIEFYQMRKHLTLDQRDPGKPVFNNRCSKQH